MSNCVVPLKDRELRVRFRHGIAELKPNETAQELLVPARQGDAASQQGCPQARSIAITTSQWSQK